MAANSSATSPNTGVVTNVATWLMAPNSDDALTSPARMAGPPPMTQALQELLMVTYRVPYTQVHFDRFF